MIILPTRSRLVKRRSEHYAHLESILPHASVQSVEAVMREIHIINCKLHNYFVRNVQQSVIEE